MLIEDLQFVFASFFKLVNKIVADLISYKFIFAIPHPPYPFFHDLLLY